MLEIMSMVRLESKTTNEMVLVFCFGYSLYEFFVDRHTDIVLQGGTYQYTGGVLKDWYC